MLHNYLVYQLKSIIDARNLYLVWHQDNHPGEPAKLPLALLDIKAFCMSCGRAGFSFTRIINYIFGVLCMFMGRYYFIINKFLQLSKAKVQPLRPYLQFSVILPWVLVQSRESKPRPPIPLCSQALTADWANPATVKEYEDLLWAVYISNTNNFFPKYIFPRF